MKKHRKAIRNNPEDTQIDRSTLWAEVHLESQAPQVLSWHAPGTGFVLDWLAGGIASGRDIQGFAMGFENLVLENARQANVVVGGD